MKNQKANTTPATPKTLALTLIDGKKVIRLNDAQGNTIVLAFKTKSGLTAYLNNQYNAGWETIASTYPKPDLKEHPDAYDRMLRVKATEKNTALEVLTAIMRDAFKGEGHPFGFENFSIAKPKTETKQPDAKAKETK